MSASSERIGQLEELYFFDANDIPIDGEVQPLSQRSHPRPIEQSHALGADSHMNSHIDQGPQQVGAAVANGAATSNTIQAQIHGQSHNNAHIAYQQLCHPYQTAHADMLVENESIVNGHPQLIKGASNMSSLSNLDSSLKPKNLKQQEPFSGCHHSALTSGKPLRGLFSGSGSKEFSTNLNKNIELLNKFNFGGYDVFNLTTNRFGKVDSFTNSEILKDRVNINPNNFEKRVCMCEVCGKKISVTVLKKSVQEQREKKAQQELEKEEQMKLKLAAQEKVKQLKKEMKAKLEEGESQQQEESQEEESEEELPQLQDLQEEEIIAIEEIDDDDQGEPTTATTATTATTETTEATESDNITMNE